MSIPKTMENKIKLAGILAVSALCALFFDLAVARGYFGGTVWDKGVYAAFSLLSAFLLGYWIWQLSFAAIWDMLRRKGFWADMTQICSFACICLMTLYYYDSSSEYGHALATRVMNCAFALALLCLYREDEGKARLISYLQALLAVCGIVRGCFLDLGGRERVLYVMSGIVVWLYCRLLGTVWLRVRRKEICRRFSRYGWLVILFFAGMVLFRNTRTWPFSVVVPFGCLYLYRFTAAGIDRFLKNFCYGCILAFWLMVGSGALFRPYYSFEFIRYPGWFSSVATAGLFWLLTLACAVSCIFAKLRRGVEIRIRKLYLEWLTLGAAGTYLLMTLSRTAALSAVLFCFAAFLLSELYYYRDPVKKMLQKLLLAVGAVLVLFPVMYTATRCGPALVGRPVWITGAEWFSDRIQKREAPDSSKYMNIAQLGETFLEKWLGLDINLTELTGAVSGPGNQELDENGEIVLGGNVVGVEEHDGQVYTVKDYTFHNPDEDDVSNGRFDIFTLYYEHLNLTGHDTMIVEDVDENITLYHAHNSYMQVAYDHGILVGLLFILVVTGGLVSAVFYYKKNCGEVNFAIYPIVVIISFMTAGLTEWIFHPSIPIGFAFLIALTPLMAAETPREAA